MKGYNELNLVILVYLNNRNNFAEQGEGSVILTGIIKPHDEGEIAASAPSSSTISLDTLKAIGVSNESVSGTNITRKAVSEINLKMSTSQGSNLQGTSQVKSSSTTTLGKNKTKEMAPPAVKDTADKDCRKNFLYFQKSI
ncbi:hypothetical protein CEXT_246721 [Caerostris extrusa]|uniref:Uncharacterized protein n=1 Tax=Caerostris extrusa TaxID=172846 RepID=A0AAV4QD60_CAEEX|nr:hypothetical protein CEXT_246721 [Caerostris extrusa]